MKEPLFRAQCARTGKWIYGMITHTKNAIQSPKGSRLAIVRGTIGEYVITAGKDRFTGDVFFEEVEHDEGDVVIYSVLVWLPDRFKYTLLGLGEYLAVFEHGGNLDETEIYDLYPEDFDKLHYKGTIYDPGFSDLCSGPV